MNQIKKGVALVYNHVPTMSMENVNIRGIGITVSPAIRTAVEKASVGVAKIADKNSTIGVKLTVDRKLHHKAEVTATCKGKTLRVEKTTEDMYKSITEAFKVMEHKIAKHNDKIVNRRYSNSVKTGGLAEGFDTKRTDEDETCNIAVRKNFVVKPMTPEDACAEMELLDHSFFVFVNSETGNVEVVYKRRDDSYGLISVNANN